MAHIHYMYYGEAVFFTTIFVFISCLNIFQLYRLVQRKRSKLMVPGMRLGVNITCLVMSLAAAIRHLDIHHQLGIIPVPAYWLLIDVTGVGCGIVGMAFIVYFPFLAYCDFLDKPVPRQFGTYFFSLASTVVWMEVGTDIWRIVHNINWPHAIGMYYLSLFCTLFGVMFWFLISYLRNKLLHVIATLKGIDETMVAINLRTVRKLNYFRFEACFVLWFVAIVAIFIGNKEVRDRDLRLYDKDKIEDPTQWEFDRRDFLGFVFTVTSAAFTHIAWTSVVEVRKRRKSESIPTTTSVSLSLEPNLPPAEEISGSGDAQLIGITLHCPMTRRQHQAWLLKKKHKHMYSSISYSSPLTPKKLPCVIHKLIKVFKILVVSRVDGKRHTQMVRHLFIGSSKSNGAHSHRISFVCMWICPFCIHISGRVDHIFVFGQLLRLLLLLVPQSHHFAPRFFVYSRLPLRCSLLGMRELYFDHALFIGSYILVEFFSPIEPLSGEP